MALVPWTYNNIRIDNKTANRKFFLAGASLEVLQNLNCEITSTQNTHYKLWDGAFLLAKYLEKRYNDKTFWGNKHVLELGAGCGLVGMVVGLLGAKKVWLTECNEAVEHTRKCLENNRSTCNLSNVDCEVLNWGESNQVLGKKFDVILGSDIIYSSDTKVLKNLIASLRQFSHTQSLILISYKPRGLGEDKFFSLLKNLHFEYNIIDRVTHPAEFKGSDYNILQIVKSVTSKP